MPTMMDWIKRAASRRSIDNRPGNGDEQATPAAANDIVMRYANLGEIARGGMGAIQKVYDREIRRELAMKVFDPADGKVDAGRVGLFVEEAQITGQLDHPNICPVHDVGADSAGTRFFTMKVVRGRTLDAIIHDTTYDPTDPRSLREAIEVVRKVCDALAFAHAKGVVHRDLKPENVMVGDFGQVYLMDWGVAKLMRATSSTEAPVTVSRTGTSPADEAGAIVGTLSYMAPEQARGEADVVDERSDVFGLGAILYEVLTQVPPYNANDLGLLVLAAQKAAWRPPQDLVGEDLKLPAALCAIAEKAMSASPSDRYPSALAVKEALDEFLAGGFSFPTRSYAAGDCIVNEGDAGHEAFIITRGYCRVYKYMHDEMVGLVDLKAGDVFGEASVFADAPRTATVQALTDVTVQVVTKDIFEKDLGLASAVGKFVGALAQRFVSTDNELRAVKEAAKAQESPAPMPPVPVSIPPPPIGQIHVDSPLRLVEVAVSLQSIATQEEPVSQLLLEALVIGTQELQRRRKESASAAAAE